MVLGNGDTLPDEWHDAETGHRVVRLSDPAISSQTLYFHQNCFTGSGDALVFVGSTAEGRSAFAMNSRTREIRRVAPSVSFEILAPKRRELFYLTGNKVQSTHLDTLETRDIAELPAEYASGRGFSVNADETLLLGCYAQGESEFWRQHPTKGLKDLYKNGMKRMFDARLLNALFTIDIVTGEVREIHNENVWFGHPQFSPTVSSQIEFCHEGPERVLDRMWLINTDGSGYQKVFSPPCRRTLVTHEFWDPEGTHVWFDLQIPRARGYLGFLTYLFGPRAYLATANISSGETVKYRIPQHCRSWHYNVSRDGSLFCGDGEGRFFDIGPSGKWIYLYRIQDGKMKSECLCDMSKHSYSIAPNAHITPDNSWVVFTSDMHGLSQVYAVEIAKPSQTKGSL
ncbi:MAG TPA: oligogalacturonate lyase family protein [Candidatus Hydrogenedentes bacterium]|nr:oligogalacturonate lyase family protein [Candidatus Hydrogenedentota bacterium]HQH54563.1 oligogalacturonate lyase family protein [Candidatus Hydrogenedentota bacterium]